MIVASLLVVVLGALLAFLDTGGKLAPTYQERGLVVREAQVALERMTRELRQASWLDFGPMWVEFEMVVREAQPGDDGDDEDGDDEDGDDEDGERRRCTTQAAGDDGHGWGGAVDCTVRVLYDCRYGADGLLKSVPPFQCRRFQGPLQRPPELPCNSSVAQTDVIASHVRNTEVFTGMPSHVQVRLELESEDFRDPDDSPEPSVVLLKDGVEPRNLGREPSC